MGNINATLAQVLLGTNQIGQILTAILGLLSIYKQARDQWEQDHPDEPSPFLTDADLFDALQGSAADLVKLADRLLAKYQDPANPPS